MNYLHVNLTNMYRTYVLKATLMKEVQEGLNELRDRPCSKIGRSNMVKKPPLDKSMYKRNTIPIKIPERFLVNIGKIILKSL